MVRFDFVVDEDLNVYIMEVRQVHIVMYVDKLIVAVQGKVNLDKSEMVHFDCVVVEVQSVLYNDETSSHFTVLYIEN